MKRNPREGWIESKASREINGGNRYEESATGRHSFSYVRASRSDKYIYVWRRFCCLFDLATLATLAEEVCQRGTPWSLELKHSGNQVGWAGSAWQLLEPPAGISVRRVHTSASQSPAGSFGSNNPTIFKYLALTCFLITLGIKILAMTSTPGYLQCRLFIEILEVWLNSSPHHRWRLHAIHSKDIRELYWTGSYFK